MADAAGRHLPQAAGAVAARDAAPAVLALGAWLKNAVCRLPLQASADSGSSGAPIWSAWHGDLGDPLACAALQASVAALQAAGPVLAVAHDLHPDFFSTRLAQQLAAALGVPAIAVQHHHAHIAAVLAEHALAQPAGHGHSGDDSDAHAIASAHTHTHAYAHAHAITEPVLGLALDGFGLGDDGQAWGGELLWLHGAQWRRAGHLQPLALPGGDAAALEPWRMAAAALHAMGRGNEIAPRFAPLVGQPLAAGVAQLLRQNLNCPTSTSAGRWFDAAAGTLGLTGRRQAHEAQAAIALEACAQRGWYAATAGTDAGAGRAGLTNAAAAGATATAIPAAAAAAPGVLDLRPLLLPLFALTTPGTVPPAAAVDHAAAVFHRDLADALANWVAAAAQRAGITTICLGGGCFANRLLSSRLCAQLARQGLRVLQPKGLPCGDAALALGQAWVARQQLLQTERCSQTTAARHTTEPLTEDTPCA
jgi:hydrogenase maturation protein HypF